MNYAFGAFTYDTRDKLLRRDGQPQRLQPRACEVLEALLRANGRLVTKRRLNEEIWQGRVLSEDAIYAQVRALRSALDDRKKPHQMIETVHALGFRMIVDVNAKGVEVIAEAQEPLENKIGRAPRIAVIPLTILGDAVRHRDIAQGLPDDLVDALSRLRWLEVIARASSFALAKEEDPLAAAGVRLNADYLLSGYLELAGAQLVLSMELADVKDGTATWRERYSIPIRTIYEMRQDVVTQVVAAIDQSIPINEYKRARLSDPSSLTAWQSFHLGLGNIYALNYPEARRFLHQARRIDPTFARAIAGLSQLHWWEIMQRQDGDEALLLMARKTAEDAIRADPNEPFANLVRARISWLDGDIGEGKTYFERALELNPNYAASHAAYATNLFMAGEAEPAEHHVERAISLSPTDPMTAAFYGIRGGVSIIREDFAGARPWFDKALKLPGQVPLILQGAFVASHHEGDAARARKFAEQLRKTRTAGHWSGVSTTIAMESETFQRLCHEAFVAHGLAD